MSHTQGKLTHRSFSIYAEDGKTPVADTCLTNSVANHDVENARRLVAAWNACEGFETDLLENIVMTGGTLKSRFALRTQEERESKAESDSLRAVNAELLEALKYIVDCSAPMTPQQEECWKSMREAIASATPQGTYGGLV